MTEEEALFEAWLVKKGIKRDVARKQYIMAARLYRSFRQELEAWRENQTKRMAGIPEHGSDTHSD